LFKHFFNMPNQQPAISPLTISVVIPTLNEAEHIVDLIQYLQLNGEGAVEEICICDGGSTDDTVALAEAAGAKVLSTGRGRSIQMNAGAAQAIGQVLYFVHADTVPPRQFVAAIKSALQEGWPMGCFRYRFKSDHWMLRINAWFTRFDWLFCQGGDKTFFITRHHFEALNGYDPRLPIMEEYDFLRRAAQRGWPFVVLKEEVLVSARKYEGRTWLTVQVANLVVFNLWRFRVVAPQRLPGIYRRLLGTL
jgi:rSAM/selenodomain-associated transferase 2